MTKRPCHDWTDFSTSISRALKRSYPPLSKNKGEENSHAPGHSTIFEAPRSGEKRKSIHNRFLPIRPKQIRRLCGSSIGKQVLTGRYFPRPHTRLSHVALGSRPSKAKRSIGSCTGLGSHTVVFQICSSSRAAEG